VGELSLEMSRSISDTLCVWPRVLKNEGLKWSLNFSWPAVGISAEFTWRSSGNGREISSQVSEGPSNRRVEE